MLKCVGIKRVLLEYVKFLDGTMLNACLKDQQLLKYIDINICVTMKKNSIERNYGLSHYVITLCFAD